MNPKVHSHFNKGCPLVPVLGLMNSVHILIFKFELPVHLGRSLKEPQSRSGRCGEEKNLALDRN
jgi:hypothetical protein